MTDTMKTLEVEAVMGLLEEAAVFWEDDRVSKESAILILRTGKDGVHFHAAGADNKEKFPDFELFAAWETPAEDFVNNLRAWMATTQESIAKCNS